ncbi:hypothetical protein EV363DRAFT_1302713 [Boletus edulis]|nr:hypothetical protein EV363DRAFT_1302713 [Boletus edulis]
MANSCYAFAGAIKDSIYIRFGSSPTKIVRDRSPPPSQCCNEVGLAKNAPTQLCTDSSTYGKRGRDDDRKNTVYVLPLNATLADNSISPWNATWLAIKEPATKESIQRLTNNCPQSTCGTPSGLVALIVNVDHRVGPCYEARVEIRMWVVLNARDSMLNGDPDETDA